MAEEPDEWDLAVQEVAGDDWDQAVAEVSGDQDTSLLGFSGYSLGGAAKDFVGGAMQAAGSYSRMLGEIGEKAREVSPMLDPVGAAFPDFRGELGTTLEENAPSSGQEGFAPDVVSGLGSAGFYAATLAPMSAVGAPAAAISAAAAAVGAVSVGGQEYFTHLAERPDDEEGAWDAFWLGVPGGLAEGGIGGVGQVMRRINKASGGRLQRSVLNTLMRESAGEGLTEGGQAFMSEVIAQHLREDEIPILQAAIEAATDPERLKRIGYQAGVGATAGAGISVLGSGVDGALTRLASQEATESTPEADTAQSPGEPEVQEAAPETFSPETFRAQLEAAGVSTGEVEGDVSPVSTEDGAQPSGGQEAGSPPLEGPGTATTTDPGRIAEPLPAPELAGPSVTEPITQPEEPAVVKAESDTTSEALGSDTDPGDTTSIKNEVVDRELEEMGLPPVKKAEKESFAEWDAEAAKREQETPGAGQELVAELDNSERAVTQVEGAMLLRERNRLLNEREELEERLLRAVEAGDDALVEVLEDRIGESRDAYEQTSRVDDRVGGTGARAMVQRKMEIKRDYSLAALERKAKVAKKGEPLTEEEVASLRELSRKYEKANKRIVDLEREAAKREADAALDKALTGIKKRTRKRKAAERPKPVVAFISKQADAARARMKQRGTRLMSGIDPAQFADAAIIGAEYIAKDISALADWSKAMLQEFGDWIKPHLKSLHAQSQEVAKRLADEARREEIGTALKGDIENPKASRKAARSLAEMFIEAGVVEREDLIDSVHAALQESLPEITRREAMDLISGYGEFQPLNQEENKKRLRELRGEMQQVSKIEDLLKGIPPKKTGPERQAPTDEARRLMREVNELKKRLKIRTIDPEKQLASALDTIKTRLRNQIKDLERQIETGVQDAKGRTTPPTDAEVEELKARRDKVKDVYDELFKKEEQRPGHTEVMRARAAERALEKQLKEMEAAVAKREVDWRKGKRASILTPKLEVLRARRDAVREELKAIRDAQNPKKTPEEIALQSYKTRKANEIARRKEQLATSDFSKKPKRTLDLDDEALALKAESDALKKQIDMEIEKARLDQRTTAERVTDFTEEAFSHLQKSLVAAFDGSMIFRQAEFFAYNIEHSLPALKQSASTILSEKNAQRIETAIKGRSNAERANAAEINVTSYDGALGVHEEAIHSRIAEKIPLIGRGIKASNRFFSTYLNLVRAYIFDWYSEIHPDATLEEDKAIAHMINAGTGRGDPGKFEAHMKTAGAILWAPHMYLAQAQLVLGPITGFGALPVVRDLPFIRRGVQGPTAKTRKIIAMQYGRLMIGRVLMMSLLGLMGYEIADDDPRSSDFMKMKTKNGTRVDMFGGWQQLIVLMARLYTGQTVRPNESKARPVERGRVLGQMAENKLNPTLGLAKDLLLDKELYGGEPITVPAVLQDFLMPIAARDIYDHLRGEGLAHGTALSVMSLAGFGTYNIPEPSVSGATSR